MNTQTAWKAAASILIIVTIMGARAGPTVAAYEELKTSTQMELQTWLSAIPRTELQDYGFKDVAELAQARVGEPFPMANIDATSLSKYAGADLRIVARDVPTRVYMPIEVGGQIRTLLEVSQRNGTWEIVAIGRTPLAREMEQARRLMPTGVTGPPRVIRVFLKNNAYEELLAVETAGRTLVFPLASTARVLRGARPAAATFVESKDVLVKLREIQLRPIGR